MRFRFRHAVLAACALHIPVPAFADGPLTLPAAIARASASHPELAELALETNAREAELRSASLRPAPEVDLLVEDVAGSGTREGLEAAQTTLSLSQLFELGGKRAGRQAVAEARVAQLRTDQTVRQLDVAAAIARSFVAVLTRQERVTAAHEAVDLSRRVRMAVDERVKAAAAPEAETSRAAVAGAEADLSLEDALHTLETARFELAAAMGDEAPAFDSVAGELFRLPASSSFDALMARLEASPDLARFLDEERLRDAEIRLAERRRSLDLRGTLGVRRFEEGDDTALVAGISVPLFAGRQAAPAVTAAQAQRDRVAPLRAAALLKARARLHAHYQEMEHARHVVTTLREQVLPQLDKALEQTEYAYRRGRYSYLEWSEAQRRRLEARSRLIDAASDFHLNLIEIERLTGQSLIEGDPS